MARRMAEESISERHAIIDALLRKYPELVVPELTIRYDRLLDEHPFYAKEEVVPCRFAQIA